MKQIAMNNVKIISSVFCAVGILAGATMLPQCAEAAKTNTPATITLPVPYTKAGLTVMEALDRRRSTRQFADTELDDKQLAAILWAANGINRPESGKRVNPTTKGIYNIDVYAVMAKGIYKYAPATHTLEQVSPEDFRPLINEKQTFVHTAPLTLVFVSNPVPPKDPSRPVNPERQHANNCLVAGTMLQSVALTAVSEGLGTCVRGSIDREAFAKAARLVPEQRVLISQTIGVPAK